MPVFGVMKALMQNLSYAHYLSELHNTIQNL